jgi:hypothetical protein
MYDPREASRWSSLTRFSALPVPFQKESLQARSIESKQMPQSPPKIVDKWRLLVVTKLCLRKIVRLLIEVAEASRDRVCVV